MTSIDPGPVLAAAGLPDEQARAVAAAWPEHGAVAPDPDFLAPEAVARSARRLGMPDGHVAALVDGLALFADRPALRRLAAYVASLLRSPPPPGGAPHVWPQLPPGLHPAAPLFCAWPLLGCLDVAVGAGRQRGIPEATTLAAFRDIERWMDFHRSATGTWGFSQIGWLQLHVRGLIHELGRLQFGPATWQSCVHAFRERRGGAVTLLMADGVALRGDGRLQGVAGLPVDHDGFVSRLREEPASWTGHPVAVDGTAQRTPLRLDRERWDRIAGPGDPILFVHIPAGPGLDPAACNDACREAVAFFSRHYPDRPFAALVSESWMFDARLAAYLPTGSNLIRFQRGFVLHPCADPLGRQIIERVFGDAAIDPRTAACRTSLQKAVAAHLAGGGYWCAGGAFMPRERAGTSFVQGPPRS